MFNSNRQTHSFKTHMDKHLQFTPPPLHTLTHSPALPLDTPVNEEPSFPMLVILDALVGVAPVLSALVVVPDVNPRSFVCVCVCVEGVGSELAEGF